MDRLKEMYDIQRLQQVAFNLNPDAMNSIRKLDTAKDMLLGMNEEVVKLAKFATRYKAHILRTDETDPVNVADALVDIIKYVFVMGQLSGLSDDDLYDAFIRKTEVVNVQARCERLVLKKTSNVVLLDLDNVVVDLSKWDENIKKARAGKVEGMSDVMVNTLESMKNEFYKCGGFLNLPALPGAVDGVAKLRKAGWIVIIISARPVWQYKRLHSDTIRWLVANKIEYDLLLFNKDKAEAIYERVFPAVPAFMIEDREKHVLEVSEIGVHVLLMDYPYNSHVAETECITRVHNWEEIIDFIGSPK